MPGRPRHGLHVVREDAPAPGVAPAAPGVRPRRTRLTLEQESVLVTVGGRLDADSAGRLRMFLAMFTVAGGPRELVLDLGDVPAVDEEGMAPIREAATCMELRAGTLRICATSPAVADHLRRAPLDPDGGR